MKNQTLTVTAVNAQATFNKSTSEIKSALKSLFPDHNFDRPITEIVTSYEAACEVIGFTPLTSGYFSFFPSEDQESAFASHQIDIIARALNGDWRPDYSKSSQSKYYAWFEWNEKAAGGPGFSFSDCVTVASFSCVGSRHSFKTYELAEYAGKTFISIYNQFLKP